MTRIPDYPSSDPAQWAAVDAYFAELLAPADDQIQSALTANSHAGLPAHDVSATQGKMLALFAQMVGATRILEIGTLGGYSTIWMARTLSPEGVIVTIESDARRADIARANVERAGLSHRVDLRLGKAADILPDLEGPFDMIFIDADKPNNPIYLDWALRLSRPGTVIIADNVVRGGAAADPTSADANVKGVREFLELIARDPCLDATVIQTVGEKGWDGFALVRVRA